MKYLCSCNLVIKGSPDTFETQSTTIVSILIVSIHTNIKCDIAVLLSRVYSCLHKYNMVDNCTHVCATV